MAARSERRTTSVDGLVSFDFCSRIIYLGFGLVAGVFDRLAFLEKR